MTGSLHLPKGFSDLDFWLLHTGSWKNSAGDCSGRARSFLLSSLHLRCKGSLHRQEGGKSNKNIINGCSQTEGAEAIRTKEQKCNWPTLVKKGWGGWAEVRGQILKPNSGGTKRENGPGEWEWCSERGRWDECWVTSKDFQVLGYGAQRNKCPTFMGIANRSQ